MRDLQRKPRVSALPCIPHPSEHPLTRAPCSAGDVKLDHVLAPTLDEGSTDKAGEEPPDFYAVAFQ